MHVIQRIYQEKFIEYAEPGKVLVLYGARRVGKTTLVQTALEKFPGKVFQGVGEDATLRGILESQSVEKIRRSFSGYEFVVIDEAQYVANIGSALKLLVDHVPNLRVVATGSSSFGLANKIGEPLTGRKRTLLLYPISMLELQRQHGPMRVNELLEELLIFGSYPETLSRANHDSRAAYLRELRDSYLYRDILQLENIRNSRKLLDLLTLVAFQIGKEVSLSELGAQLGLSKQTVARYLDLLEKAFVLKNVRGFSRNLRKEVSKTSRYYFLDNGVRNAVINNFNPLNRRDDLGALWENLMFVERLKKRDYLGPAANCYFWRTYGQQEIDLVEEREGNLFGFEFKFSAGNLRVPKDWQAGYPGAKFEQISHSNFLPFVTEDNAE